MPHQRSIVAAAFMLGAAGFIAMTTLLAKALGTGTLGDPLHPFQITSGRFVFAFAAIGVLALVKRLSFVCIHWPLHIGRSFLGASGATLMFAAAAMIPLADATAISFLNPIFAMFFAMLILGERVGPWRWLAAAVALCGALVLLRPGSGAVQTGALVALAAAVIMGLEITIIKRLTGKEPPLQILFINNLIGVCLIALPAWLVWTAPTPGQWLGLAALGLAMAAAQGCYLQSLSRADASYVVPFSYATLIFAALYDAGLFGSWPDAISILGAAIIIAGAFLQAWRESKAQRGLAAAEPEA